MTEREKYELTKYKLYYAMEQRKRKDFQNLYDIQKALNADLIEKAYNWLSENAEEYLYGDTYRLSSMLVDFKQAMQNGAE